MRVLLVIPPFTQLNTPYPATSILKGYLQSKGYEVYHMDLGIEVIGKVFSKDFLEKAIASVAVTNNNRKFISQKGEYLKTVNAVISFLRNEDLSLATRIASDSFLPQGQRFKNIGDLDWSYGNTGLYDRARHLSTLYLEDIADFIRDNIDPHFSLVRYAESIALSAHSFDSIERELQKKHSLLDDLIVDTFKLKVESLKPDLVGFSVPFPGCLYSALRCGEWVKTTNSNIVTVIGGGYPNTELRSLKESRIFNYIDFITLDDGEVPLERLCRYVSGSITEKELVRTYYLSPSKEVYYSGNDQENISFEEIPYPDFQGLPLSQYISLIEVSNPMHKLWTDGFWNKLTVAHGCYWAKCSFCDTTLDYICRYDAPSFRNIISKMDSIKKQTGSSGFHFTDEALPPKLLLQVSQEIINQKKIFSFWGNIRFEKFYKRDVCSILSKAGLIAVSGGLEVVSDRLLSLINKGVSLEQAIRTINNFSNEGILVHTYLMYGFPNQSLQDTIDALEIVKQIFDEGLVQSAFWHRYSMTAHSSMGNTPEKFGARRLDNISHSFANNDVDFTDDQHLDLDMIGRGLEKATYNFMHGIGLDYPLQYWFDEKVPKTIIPKRFISNLLLK